MVAESILQSALLKSGMPEVTFWQVMPHLESSQCSRSAPHELSPPPPHMVESCPPLDQTLLAIGAMTQELSFMLLICSSVLGEGKGGGVVSTPTVACHISKSGELSTFLALKHLVGCIHLPRGVLGEQRKRVGGLG